MILLNQADPDQVAHTLAGRWQHDIGGLRTAAKADPFDGRTDVGQGHRLVVPSWADRDLAISLILTHDSGTHESGWWRNSDYNTCWHLSFCAMTKSRRSPQLADMPEIDRRAWPRVFFPTHFAIAWWEPPAAEYDPHRSSPQSRYTWHVRLFTDREGRPIKPEGEVYTLKPWAEGDSPEKVFR